MGFIKVTSPDGGESVMSDTQRRKFEIFNIRKERINNHKNSLGIKLPLFKIEDCDEDGNTSGTKRPAKGK